MSDVLDEMGEIAGSSEMTAALALNWTPLKLRRYKERPEFQALLRDAEEGFLDAVETAVKQQALKGTRWATEMVLYNRRPDTWRPPAHKIAVEHTDRTTLEVVHTAAGALRELIQAGGASDVAALQQRAIEAHASDAD
jgi:hypothetical protein